MNFEKMRELRRKTKENAETFHSIADNQKPDPKYLQPLARKITVMESVPVSYTHLDVYKRQIYKCCMHGRHI